MATTLAFAMYRPKQGRRDALLGIVDSHVPTLREYGMVTERANYVAQSTDGTIIEVFEWVSDEAKRAAHEHPAVAALWEKMYALCDFGKMKDLPEAGQQFPDFKLIKTKGEER